MLIEVHKAREATQPRAGSHEGCQHACTWGWILENSAGEGGLSAAAMAFVEDTATLPSLPQLELFCPPAISVAKPKQQQGCGPDSQARTRHSLHCKCTRSHQMEGECAEGVSATVSWSWLQERGTHKEQVTSETGHHTSGLFSCTRWSHGPEEWDPSHSFKFRGS